MRCPRCMSFSYKPGEGCTFCGYKERKDKGPSKAILIIGIILAVIGAAALFFAWQSGAFDPLLERAQGDELQFIRRPEVIPTEVIPAEPAAVSEAAAAVPEVQPTAVTGPVLPVLPMPPNGIRDQDDIREIVSGILSENRIPDDGTLEESLTVMTGLVLQRMQEKKEAEEAAMIIRDSVPEAAETPEEGPMITRNTGEDEAKETDAEAAPRATAAPAAGDPACKNQVSRFTPGMTGVKAQVNRASRVRKDPSVSAEIVGSLTGTQSFTVENQAAVCNENYLWLKISVENSGIIGWTVEGDGTTYWLKPQE